MGLLWLMYFTVLVSFILLDESFKTNLLTWKSFTVVTVTYLVSLVTYGICEKVGVL